MAGPWLRYRGHLENISKNLLLGAVNYFTDKPNSVLNKLNESYISTPELAKVYKENKISSIIIGDENYGEGSSREHAAMEPRFMGVKVVLVKSYARIHETNLKKQGILALTFSNASDYDKINEKDTFSIHNILNIEPGKELKITIHHNDGSSESIYTHHTFNNNQIDWLKAGSALNLFAAENK